MHIGFWWGDLRERARLEYLGVDGRIILKWIFKKFEREALRERARLEYLGVDWRIILKCIFKKLEREAWNGSSWLGIGTGGGRDVVNTGSIKRGEFLDWLRN